MQPVSSSADAAVDEARRVNEDKDRIRLGQEAAYRFMSAVLGNASDFEEATRALFAGDAERWHSLQEHAALRAEQAEARHAELAERLPEAEDALRTADATAADPVGSGDGHVGTVRGVHAGEYGLEGEALVPQLARAGAGFRPAVKHCSGQGSPLLDHRW